MLRWAWDRLIRLGVWNVGLVIGTIMLIWAGIAITLQQQSRNDENNAFREAGNLASGLAETTLAAFDMVDQTLKVVREDYARDPEDFDLPAWARAHAFDSRLIIQVSIVDRQGILRRSSVAASPPPVDLSDRPHIRFQRESSSDEMFISVPLTGRVSGVKSLNVTRRLFGPDGSYAGAVVVSVGLDYLTRFYNSLSVGGGLVALVGSGDGRVRALAPADDGALGGVFPDTDRMAQGAPAGQFFGAREPGGDRRLVSYRQVQGYPLVVVVGLSERGVLAEFRAARERYLAAGGALTGLFVMVGVLLIRQRQTLLSSQTVLTAALENMSQGIMMVDRAGRVAAINRRAIELLGLPRELVDRRPTFREILDYQLATDEFGRGTSVDGAVLDLLVEGGISPRFAVYERKRANGTTLQVRTEILPDGGAVRTYTDITDLRRQQEALATARDVAEEALRVRSEFLAMMSHEIRTPLNGIIGMADVLRGMTLDPAVRDHVTLIAESGNHLLQLVNNGLDIARLDADRLSLEERALDVATIVQSVIDLVRYDAKSEHIDLSGMVADDVPSPLFGDAARLRQVLLNLVSNGVKFTPSGHVRVAVRKIRDEADVVRIGFTVSDSGIGIPAEALGRLFTDFTQVDSSISRRFGGSGLGLAISRRLVERMGGGISVESTPGNGSIFRFDVGLRRLPSGTDAANAAGARHETKKALDRPRHGGEIAPAQALRVLLAEDNPTNRIVATLMLERMGHHVASVENGREALRAVQAGAYDLVLMDMMMPEMDGLAATRAIRALPDSRAGIAIIGLSANSLPADRAACLAAGMHSFMTKPVNAAELQATIDRVVAAVGATAP